MAEYIERDALLKRLEVTPLLMYRIPACIRDGVLDLVSKQPAADVAPVRPELRLAVKLLNTNYEKGLKNPVIRDPLAWALFQTWKAMNGGADNE